MGRLTASKSAITKVQAIVITAIVIVALIAGGAYWYFTRPPPAPVTIKFIGEVTPITDELKKLVPEFEEETGIEVVWETYAWDAFVSKLMMDLSAATGIYDVATVGITEFPLCVAEGYIQPLDQFVEDPKITPSEYDWDDLIPELMDRGVVNDVRYAIPFTHYINYLTYRTDLLEDPANKEAFETEYGYEYGIPPRNLAEYKDIIEFFHDPPTLYGTTLCAKRGYAAVCDYLVLVFAHGGHIVSEEGTPLMGTPECIDAMYDYIYLLKHSSPGAVEFEWDASCESFGRGEVALSIQWADHGVYFEKDPSSSVAGKCGYAPFPSIVTGKPTALWDGSYIAIPTASKHPREAYEFIKWVMSKDTQLKWAEKGSTPSRYSAFENPELSAEWAFWKALRDSMEVVKTHPLLPETPEIEDVIALYLSKAAVGEMTVEEACAAAQAEIAEILG